MNYPLSLSFKLLALASQIYVRDANGRLIGYVKQKLFKLKEDVNVFADEQQTQLLYNIKADRVIDWSANYSFTDAAGAYLGSIKRQGMRSIWKANYDVFGAAGNAAFKINEENGWIKVADAVVGELPIIGMLTGYFFNPSYLVSRPNGEAVARLSKQPAFFEGKFQFDPLVELSDDEETNVMLALLMMVLLERQRG
ncbi:MAG TPA: hypothetical protein VJL58_07525 [Pyrinomonadaceae bacterium]|nr:hypothetical protein [Pyrinomonadaceae bacterium]